MTITAKILKFDDDYFGIGSYDRIGESWTIGYGTSTLEAKNMFEEKLQDALTKYANEHNGILPDDYQQIIIHYQFEPERTL